MEVPNIVASKPGIKPIKKLIGVSLALITSEINMEAFFIMADISIP
jgi:hypothetical protein